MAITKLKQERLKRKWTLECVGQQLGITNQAIHLIETLKSNPSYDVLLKLEDLFGLPHRILLARADNDSQSNYTNSQPRGVEKVKELEKAHRKFDLDAEAIIDIAADGQLDCPERREAAASLYEKLGDVLGKPA